MKLADVRFYFDADILGIAKILAGIRSDVTYPGDPGAVIHRRVRQRCSISDPEMDDDKWIPIVTDQGWLIVTRDAQIREHRAEIEAVRNAGARMVVLSGADAASNWYQLEVVMRQWRGIESLLNKNGPFIYLATRSTLKPLAI